MPFKSKAQRRKFAELLVTGKISDETYEEWNRSTGTVELPERVKPKVKSRSKAKSKSKIKIKIKAKTKAKRKTKSKRKAKVKRKTK